VITIEHQNFFIWMAWKILTPKDGYTEGKFVHFWHLLDALAFIELIEDDFKFATIKHAYSVSSGTEYVWIE
jgi:hypothetical protein